MVGRLARLLLVMSLLTAMAFEAQAKALKAITESMDATEKPAVTDGSESATKTKAQTFLLHGVTGSGKTEVYLQAIAHALSRGEGAIVLERTIDVHVKTLRKKMAEAGAGELIETVRGVGYRFRETADE